MSATLTEPTGPATHPATIRNGLSGTPPISAANGYPERQPFG